MIEMRRKWRMIWLGSFLGFVLMRPVPVPAAPQDDERVEIERYMESEYTWCDTALLARVWGESLWDAKLRIGRKIGWGDYDVIEEFLGEAREQNRDAVPEECAFHNSDFTFEDAETLADFWGLSIGEAKSAIESALFEGDAKVLRTKLADIRSVEPAENGASDDVAADTFWTKGYTFCDARLVAEIWDTDVWDAKVSIGYKVLEGGTATADEALSAFRQERPDGFTCDYADEGYTYDDMVTLADFWGESVGDTKTIVEDKILWGLNRNVRSLLDELYAD